MDFNFSFKCACGWASHPWQGHKTKHFLLQLAGRRPCNVANEMVSLGDTAISLHILQLPLTGEAGRGVFWKVKTQSAMICLNFNFQEGGGGVFWEVKTQSAKICLNFNFQGGGGMFWEVKTQSAKICLNFNFLGEGGILFWNQIPGTGVFWRIWSNIF